MTVYQMLATLERPVAYGYHSTPQTPPYFCIMGSGQDVFAADNTYIAKDDRWQIEYYYKTKNPEYEATIESLLLTNGYQYEKSEDVYLEDEDLFLIYYYI